MKNWNVFLKKRSHVLGQRGAALVEYGILVGLISVLSIVSVAGLGGTVRDTFAQVDDELVSRIDLNDEAPGAGNEEGVPDTSEPVDETPNEEPVSNPIPDPEPEPAPEPEFSWSLAGSAVTVNSPYSQFERYPGYAVSSVISLAGQYTPGSAGEIFVSNLMPLSVDDNGVPYNNFGMPQVFVCNVDLTNCSSSGMIGVDPQAVSNVRIVVDYLYVAASPYSPHNRAGTNMDLVFRSSDGVEQVVAIRARNG